MKKLLYTIAAIAAVTMAASCARETEVAQVNGEQVTATFSVELPGVATKAISDGKTAAELNFAVYDEAGNYLQTLSETAAQVTKTSDLHWTVTVPVIKDLTYQFVFVAKKASGIYTLDKANASLSVDYSAVDANTDDYDLFYAVTTEEIGNDLKKAVNLTRPLAQVNIGASDLAAAAYSLDVANMTTGITLSGIHTGLNLLTGAVTEATSDVTFAPAARVNEETAFVTGFDRIAMAYVLVGEKQTTTATFTAVANGTADNASHTVTREVENVPIQRNYRTNIVGPIFTSTMEFNVTVEPGFVQNGDFTVVPVVVSNVSALNTALSESKEETTDLNYEVTTVEETTANTNTAVIVIPDNTKAASLTFNLSDVEVNAITIQDETPATDESNYAKDIVVEVPEGINLNNVTVNTPNAHVTLKQGTYTTVISTTSGSTLVVEAGTTIETLTVIKGNVLIEAGATVNTITRHNDNTDPITEVLLPSENSTWTNIDQNTDTKIVPRYPTAQIANAFYYSLAEAVAAAQEGDTITLLRDEKTSLTDGSELVINKSLTITGDVAANGEPLFTIYGKKTVAGSNDIFINGNGTVTLSNLKVKEFGNNTGTDAGHAPIYVSTNFTGTVNLNNVYVSDFNRGGIFLYGGTFNVNDCYIDCANARSGAFTKGIEIKGSAHGTISDTFICNMERANSAAPAGIEIYGNGSIEVANCTIVSDNGNHASVKATYGIVSSRVGVHNPSGGSAHITDCMFECTNACLSVADSDDYGEVNNYSFIVDGCDFDNYIATWSATSSITINSGSYAEDVYADAGTIIIHGGEFVNFAPATDTGTIIIDGGTFDANPSQYVAEGYHAEPSGDLWIVAVGSGPTGEAQNPTVEEEEEP